MVRLISSCIYVSYAIVSHLVVFMYLSNWLQLAGGGNDANFQQHEWTDWNTAYFNCPKQACYKIRYLSSLYVTIWFT